MPIRTFLFSASLLFGGVALCAAAQLKIEKDCLHIPRDDSQRRTLVRLLDNGREVRHFEAQIADNDSPKYWSNVDVSAWKGKTLAVEIAEKPADAAQLALWQQGDSPRLPDNLYKEPLRPQTRFTARMGRLNDPNGLSYYNGEWHMFFQFAPYGDASADKHWGHAVSKDLVHWEELDIALFPSSEGMVFSGSAVVDKNNTSGLGKGGKEPLVLHYTVAPCSITPKGLMPNPERYQALAYSLDGRTFTDFRDTPTVPYFARGNRDPKVVWHASSRQWIMALFAGGQIPNPEGADKKPVGVARVHFFGSKNLRNWTKLSHFDGESAAITGKTRNYLNECPDLFALSTPDGKSQRWILTGGGGKYRIGNFDGKNFVPETEVIPLWEGARYAAQTFSDAPDGKIYQLGWMNSTPFKGMPFSQCMDLPVELSLVQTPEGLRMKAEPIEALKTLRGAPVILPETECSAGAAQLDLPKTLVYEAELALRPEGAKRIELQLPNAALVYDVGKQTLKVGKLSLPAPLENGVLRLRIFGDGSIVQIFRADCLYNLSAANLPVDTASPWQLKADGGATTLEHFVFYPLRSIWEK